ncbi:hypothetical protein F5Y18DRAFT_433563 [Xylariaceae sp. FL1019]|nr:hypothetical protein F5Y18DRAFT_433563 [Xylariaceae sp. FL1019]
MVYGTLGLRLLHAPSKTSSIDPDVIVVHGLYGSGHRSWTDSQWRDDFMKPSKRYRRLFNYSYDVFGLNGGILTREGAREEATKLLDLLLKERLDVPEVRNLTRMSMLNIMLIDLQRRALVVIGHDVGGSLIKEALGLAAQKKYESIYNSIIAIVFLGCPHQGPEADIRSSCAELLMSQRQLTFLEAWNLAGPLVDWIQTTNVTFHQSKISVFATIFTVASLHPDSSQRVYPADITSMPQIAHMLTTELKHEDMLRHPLKELTEVIDVDLARKRDFSYPDPRLYEITNHPERRLREFVLRSVPHYPVDVSNCMLQVPRSSPIYHDFEDFLNADGSRCWLISTNDSPSPNAIDMALSIFEWFRDLTPADIFLTSHAMFTFGTPEYSKINNAETALICLIMQLSRAFLSLAQPVKFEHPETPSREYPYLTDKDNIANLARGFRRFSIGRKITFEDLCTVGLASLVQRLRTWEGQYPFQRLEPRKPVFLLILGNVSTTIENAVPLMQVLGRVSQDCGLNLKIIATSSDSQLPTLDTGFTVTSIPRVKNNRARSVAEISAEDTNRSEDPTLSMAVLKIIQSQPSLYHHRAAVEELVLSCREDLQLWHMITSLIQSCYLAGDERLQDFLSHLTTASIEQIFSLTLDTLPSNVQSCLVQILEYVEGTFRPLTISELLLLPYTDRLRHARYRNPELQAAVTEGIRSGLLVCRASMYYMAHARCQISALESFRGTVRTTQIINEHLALACLEFLTAPIQRQEMVYRAGPGRLHLSLEKGDDFLSYATKYWVQHATRASAEIWRSAPIANFLADDETVMLWTILYQDLSSIPLRHGLPFDDVLASLVIFATYGLEDLVMGLISKHQSVGTAGLDQACSAILAVAAGCGHIGLVKQLLSTQIPLANLDEAVFAAIEGDSKELFVEIVHAWHAPAQQEFVNVLVRACSLGRTDYVETLLHRAQEVELDINVKDMLRALRHALQGGHNMTAKFLLSGERISFQTIKFDQMEELAEAIISLGSIDMVEVLLFLASIDPTSKEAIECRREIITQSSRHHRRKPIQSVLDHFSQLAEDTVMSSTDDMQDVDLLSSYVGLDPEVSVLQVLIDWPFAVDLLRQVCELQWSSRRHPDFSEYFPSCVEAAAENADIAAIRIVFETGARSQLATPPILQLGVEEGFAAAVRTFSIPSMQYFVAKGVDVNKHLMKGKGRPSSPLAYAIRGNSPASVSFLIDAGADIEMPNIWGRYPLTAAVEYNQIEITRVLIAAGANVNVRERDHWGPPLRIASRAEVARELLKARHNDGTLRLALESALHSSGNSPGVFLEILAQYPDASSLPDIDCLLHYQVLYSNMETLQLLLGDRYKLDVTKRSIHGDTPLHWISERTDVAVIQLLLSYGAQIEAVNNRGSTPLTVAASKSNFPVAACLVERGARINASHGLTDSPFFWACYKGGLEMVQVMHNSSIDPANINMVNTISRMGTPLNAALFRAYIDEDSVSPIIKREREKIVKDNEQVVQYLLDEGNAEPGLPSTYWRSAFQVACLTCPISTISMLIERSQLNVNAADSGRRTPLHMALYRTPAHVQLLLDLGADLDAVDAIGRNALHFAVLSGNLDVMRLVMDKRPGFVNKADIRGWTPLLWALRCKKGGALNTPNWVPRELHIRDVVKELLSRGARRLVRGRWYIRTWTPMVVAKYNGWLDPEASASNVRDLLMPSRDDYEGASRRDVEWDWNASGDKVGERNPDESAWCDHCLLRLDGYFYLCTATDCVARYCAHCYQSRDKLHNPEHAGFRELGRAEYIPSDDESEISTDDESED